jgi:FMN phosphatase YigB (HAD superfamily)
VYVGDDLESDGSAARAAGVAFCWLDWRRPNDHAPAPAACRRVVSLPEIAPLLGL